MLNFLKKNLHIIILLALCFWAVKALFVPGYFPSHDDEQIARIFELDKGLNDGQIPVRWVSDLGFGYGYPLFNFYPPLTYYSADFLHRLGFSFIDSAKAVFILGFLFSSLFMYLWVKEHFGKIAGIFSALLYVYAPYHAVNIYVRGSLPDFIAYSLLPLLFWLSDRLFKKKKVSYAIILGILAALIPLTHILKLVSVIPIFGIYILYLFFEYRKELKRLLLLSFLSLLIAFGLSSFFLIPAILEKGFTMVDKINTGELYSYKLHFVCVKEFFNSTWGYGGSLPDCMSGLSFELGKIHILFVILAFLIFVSYFFKRKLSQFKLPLLIFLMFLLSIYMANSHSQWIWDRIGILSYLQFPWRFLDLAALFSSFIGGFVIYYAQKRFGDKIALGLLVVFGFVAIVIVASDFQPQNYLNVKDSYYTNLDDIRWRISKASFEFVPRGIITKLSDIGTTQVDINAKDLPTIPYKIVKGDVRVKILVNKSQSKLFEINSKGKSIIQINTFSFPGWITFLDGKEIQYLDDNKLKLITVPIPSGSHNLEVEFTNTLPRAVGNAISLVTLFNLIGFGIIKIWKK